MQINLPPYTPHQQQVSSNKKKRKVWDAGKRTGKTDFGAKECHKTAARGGTAWWIARTYTVGENGWAYIRELALKIKKYVPDIRIIESEPFTIIYPNGGMIVVRAVGDKPNDLRGFPLDLVIFDEAAYIPNLKEAWLAVQTGLLDRDGTAIFISSPFGRNYFFTLFQRGNPNSTLYKPGWQSFRSTTFDNPFMSPDRIHEMMEDMDELEAQQEIFAQFIDGSGLVFRGVDRVAKLQVQKERIPHHSYSLGGDWGRVKDETVFAVVDVTAKQQVDLLTIKELDTRLQLNAFYAMYHKWKPDVSWLEQNSLGIPLLDQLQKDENLNGIRAFMTSGANKGPLIDSLQLAIEREDLQLLDDKKQRTQLVNYQQVPMSKGGGYKFSAPPGEHDDCVIALALAWRGASYSGGVGKATTAEAPQALADYYGGGFGGGGPYGL